jgi:hypothetical protein
MLLNLLCKRTGCQSAVRTSSNLCMFRISVLNRWGHQQLILSIVCISACCLVFGCSFLWWDFDALVINSRRSPQMIDISVFFFLDHRIESQQLRSFLSPPPLLPHTPRATACLLSPCQFPPTPVESRASAASTAAVEPPLPGMDYIRWRRLRTVLVQNWVLTNGALISGSVPKVAGNRVDRTILCIY